MNQKIKVKEITITRSEGPSKLCRKPRTFKTWEEANAHMARCDCTYPTEGYDKHDLLITFEDGGIYQGRLDVKHSSCKNPNQDVRQHVKETLEWFLEHPDSEEDRQQTKAFLETYDI